MFIGNRLIRTMFERGLWRARINNRDVAHSELHIGPNSIDVRINLIREMNKFIKVPVDATVGHPRLLPYTIDPREPFNMELCFEPNETMHELQPGHFALASTIESFDTDAPIPAELVPWFGEPLPCVQTIDSRSTVARMGVTGHLSAGLGDVGFKERWVLECANLGGATVVLAQGMRVAQVVLQPVIGCDLDYMENGGAYANADPHGGPTLPRTGPGRF